MTGELSVSTITAPVSDTSKPIEHVKRQYQTFPGSQYVLPSDTLEMNRLSLQHQVLIRAFENRLILPPLTLTGGESILDSGTGSGIWLLDAISRTPPAVMLCGIDIEPRLFPTDDIDVVTRGNIQFTVGTITKLPSEWNATFILIHQRLLIAALRSGEWKRAIDEMLRALVPSGWVQLGEAGPWKAGPVTAKHRSLVEALFASKGLLLNCSVHIPAMLKDAGFINIQVEERTIPIGSWAGQEGIDARDNFMGVFRGMKTSVLNLGGLGFVRTEDEWDMLLDEVQKEWDETPGAEIKFMIFYAQKPEL